MRFHNTFLVVTKFRGCSHGGWTHQGQRRIPIGLWEAKAIIGNDRLCGYNHWPVVHMRLIFLLVCLFISLIL